MIEERLNEIQSILEAGYDSDNGNIINERLTLISTLMAESGKLLADATLVYEIELKKGILEVLTHIPDYTSASVQNSLVKTLCANNHKVVILADRINRACVHQIDTMRTQLSYIKTLIQS